MLKGTDDSLVVRKGGMDDLASCVNRAFSWQYEIEARSILGTGLKLEVVLVCEELRTLFWWNRNIEFDAETCYKIGKNR